ncbi:nuclear transport factor 2 family protein [Rhodococcus erythropolis]
MANAAAERNKAFVLEAFDTLFNQRDYTAAQRFWSPDYIQHSAHIEPGRDGLFNLIKNSPAEMRYQNALTIADGDYVMLHGRFSNTGQLDRRRRRAHAGRPTRRTLGCPAGRGHGRGAQEWAAHVRRHLR